MHHRRAHDRPDAGLDDQPEQSRKIRSVLFANCALIPGGIDFIPQAMIDDRLRGIGSHAAGADRMEHGIAARADIRDMLVIALDGGSRLQLLGNDARQGRRLGQPPQKTRSGQQLFDVVIRGEIVGLDQRRLAGIGRADLQMAAAGRAAGRHAGDEA